MEKIKIKICGKCKIEKSFSEFTKGNDKNGLQYWCKLCCAKYRKSNTKKSKRYMKQYHTNNKERILKQNKQYRENNKEQIAKRAKQYQENNSEHIKKYQKKYNKNNKEKLIKQRKQYYTFNAENISEYQKQYYKDNTEKVIKRTGRYRVCGALFKTYYYQLAGVEEVRQYSENLELLEVRCAYCGRWLVPNNSQVLHRVMAINTLLVGECRFYCSENCKQACPTYNQNKWPKGFKHATSREVVPLLRQLVLKRDNYECQKCGATTETTQLHVHHILSYRLNTMLANDPDSCITLCKECHKKIHQQDGCKYVDLKCQKDVFYNG